MLQVLKLCNESLKCFQGHYRFSLYFRKILYGLWWQLVLGYSKHFWLRYKDLREGQNIGTHPAMICVSAFSNMLDLNQITLHSHLET